MLLSGLLLVVEVVTQGHKAILELLVSLAHKVMLVTLASKEILVILATLV
jgi:hypothetical protein